MFTDGVIIGYAPRYVPELMLPNCICAIPVKTVLDARNRFFFCHWKTAGDSVLENVVIFFYYFPFYSPNKYEMKVCYKFIL